MSTLGNKFIFLRSHLTGASSSFTSNDDNDDDTVGVCMGDKARQTHTQRQSERDTNINKEGERDRQRVE